MADFELRPKYYILDGHTPVPVPARVWSQWFGTTEQRIVKQTQVSEDVRVSTVFLGLDHNFALKGLPVLFETMVFGGLNDGWQDRYHTWEEAETGHEEVVSRLLKGRRTSMTD